MAELIIPNLVNAGRVLKHLAQVRAGRRPGEIAKALGIPRTTVIRILNSLAAEDLVVASGREFVLGPALITLGTRARETIKIGEMARPLLAELSRKTGETVQLALPLESASLILEVHKGEHPFTASTSPGSTVDIHCSATGKVFLAWLHRGHLQEFLKDRPLTRRTPATLTSAAALAAELERIRAAGYALDEEEYYPGVRCVAAPVFDHEQKVVAALGITSSVQHFKRELTEPWAKLLIDAARSLSAQLGAR